MVTIGVFMRRFILIIPAAFVFLVFISTCGHVEPTFARPSRNAAFGSGIESAGNQGGINILLHANYRRGEDLRNYGNFRIFDQSAYLDIAGDLAIDPSSDGLDIIKFANVSLVPYFVCFGDSIGFNEGFFGFQLLPIEFRRDIRVNQRTSFNFSALGINAGTIKKMNKSFYTFGTYGLDFIGYKNVDFLSSGADDFRGFRIVGLAIEGGGRFVRAQGLQTKASIGGSIDFNSGGSHTQSSPEAYLALQADVTESIFLFIRAGVNVNCGGGGKDCISAQQAMLRVSVSF